MLSKLLCLINIHSWVYEMRFGKFYKSCKCGIAKRISESEYFKNKNNDKA